MLAVFHLHPWVGNVCNFQAQTFVNFNGSLRWADFVAKVGCWLRWASTISFGAAGFDPPA